MRSRSHRWHYAKLRHRVFGSIVVSIVITAAIVIFSTYVFEGGGYRNYVLKVERFISHRLADAWDDPSACKRLAAEVEETFNVTVTL